MYSLPTGTRANIALHAVLGYARAAVAHEDRDDEGCDSGIGISAANKLAELFTSRPGSRR